MSLIAILLSFSALADGADPKGMNIEKSLALKVAASPKLSPDGKWVVYTLSEWDREKNRRTSHLHLVPAQGGASIRLTNGEKGETNPEWSPDSTQIAFLADRSSEAGKGNQVWLIRAAGGEAWQLTKEESAVSGIAWAPDGKSLAYVVKDAPKDKADREKKKKDKFDAIQVEENLEYSHLWTIAVDSGKTTRLTQGTSSASTPRFSPDGKSIAYVWSPGGASESAYRDITDDRRSDIYIVPAEGGVSSRLTANPAEDSSPEWSPDGTRIAFLSRTDPKSWAAKVDVYVVPSSGGAPVNLTKDWNESASNPTWSGDQIYFSGGMGLYGHVYSVPAAGGKVKPVTSGNRVLSQFDSASGKMVYLAGDPSHTDDVYIAAADGTSEARLTLANPQLEEIALGQTEVVRWKGAEGLEIEGLLLKPVGYEAGKRYPMILQVHGGPHSRYTASLVRTAQIYAANGYAVLMPNPRGSTGYGTRFMQSNNGDWGGKDFQDLMAGVDSMIAKGVADGDKLVVAGGSYGGFMTFWTITQTNRFKAAIGHAGISDWYSFYGQSDIPGLMEYGFTGHPWVSTATYRKYSPITYVDKVTTPILITHGEQDRRVAIAQAEEYYRALKLRGVNVQFVRYPREGHGITEPNHQIDQAGRHLAWLKQFVRR